MKICDSHSINLCKHKKTNNLINRAKLFFPYVSVNRVEDYFMLPKEKREKWGIYLKPIALPFNIFCEEENGWCHFSKEIRKKYPIQGWIREWLFSFNNPVYSFLSNIRNSIRDKILSFRFFLNPVHYRFRKAYPRHKWQDISHSIVAVNYAMIQDFYHEEMSRDFVDWNSTKEHQEFFDWINKSIYWIEKARPQAKKEIESKYAKISNKNESYSQKYSGIIEIENIIEDTDSRILKQMVEYRGFFWT